MRISLVIWVNIELRWFKSCEPFAVLVTSRRTDLLPEDHQVEVDQYHMKSPLIQIAGTVAFWLILLQPCNAQ